MKCKWVGGEPETGAGREAVSGLLAVEVERVKPHCSSEASLWPLSNGLVQLAPAQVCVAQQGLQWGGRKGLGPSFCFLQLYAAWLGSTLSRSRMSGIRFFLPQPATQT